MAMTEDLVAATGVAYARPRPARWLGADVPPETTPARPGHAGHRERLRARAAVCLDALPDYELMELLLARSLPRGDIKPIAKALLTRFGGLAGVLGAGLEELKAVAGVGPSAALDLKLVHEATLRMGRGEVKKRPSSPRGAPFWPTRASPWPTRRASSSGCSSWTRRIS